MEKRIIANNDNIKRIVRDEIKRLGNKADLNHIDVSGVTDMNSLFEGLQFNGDISKWDVSKVKNMVRMFSYSKFNQDISKWDVSNVENMGGMFFNSKFNQDISGWDVSNVEYMNLVFKNSKFNGDISKWNVSNVKYMNYMFYKSRFNQDISNWDVGNIESMYSMFENSPFDKNIDMWNYNFKVVEEVPHRFNLSTKGSYTLIEKYVKALKSEKFDLAERIKFKMKGIRFNYRYKDVNESKHLVTLDSKLLKEFKEYLWKRK